MGFYPNLIYLLLSLTMGLMVKNRVALHARTLFGDTSFTSLVQRHRPFICPFDKLIEQVPVGSRVLDIGCGAGLFLGLLATIGRIPEGVGFDANPSAVAAARKMSLKLASGRLDFLVLGIDDAWPDGPFDIVSLIDVMHHVPKSMRFDLLRSAVEHLGPSGIFIYKDMVDRPIWRATANRMHDLLMVRQWINYEPVEAVEAACREQGLELIHKVDLNMLWYGHELRVFRRPGLP